MPTRRSLLVASLLAPALPAALPRIAHAEDATGGGAEGGDPRFADRAIGTGPVVVQEFFSLTCTHCAAFQRETFPRVKAELIDAGKVRYIWRDYPLDQLALYAAMVARALPVERYEPFVTALLATQDRWAFTRSANPVEELAKLAMLAGMARTTFDATVRDDKLKQFVLDEQSAGEKKFGVNSTPTFVINDKPYPGAMGFDAFSKAVDTAAS